MFTSIVLELDMELDGNVDRFDATLEDAKQYCLVLNSLRVPVVVETQVRTPNQIVEELPRPFEMWPVPARDRNELAQRRAS
jgi:hypothetical protein